MIYLQTFEKFLPKFTLVTSNKRKIREYKEFLPDLRIEEGKDLPEVESDDVTVALYKGVDNGPFTISEDTSLEIEGEEIGVNLKWFKSKIPTFVGKKAYWKVLLAKNDGEYIKIYEGFIKGEIIASEDTSSFDHYFSVDGYDKTLGELKATDIEPALYSARAMAAKNLREDKFIVRKRITFIPEWTGKYQNS
jgi:inosine/xanthosine triphosphate pyrophosphatase family protein